jgi:hypothetical protein
MLEQMLLAVHSTIVPVPFSVLFGTSVLRAQDMSDLYNSFSHFSD